MKEIKAKARARAQAKAHGPVVHHDISGGSANNIIGEVGGAHRPTKGKGAAAVPGNKTTELEGGGIAGLTKTGVNATAGNETVASVGQGAHGGEGGAAKVQTIGEVASVGNETVEGVGGGDGALGGGKNGHSSSGLTNGGTLSLFTFTFTSGLCKIVTDKQGDYSWVFEKDIQLWVR